MRKFALTADKIAFLGDDLIDLPVLTRVGLSLCPADAPQEVREQVDFISSYAGGKGVLREAIELILKATGAWERLVREYVS